MDNSTDPSADNLRQRMAQIRSSSRSDVNSIMADVETITAGLRQKLDWRYQLQQHPWAFAGAAAVIGYMLMPRGRAKALLDTTAIKKLAEELNLPLRSEQKKGLLHEWILPLAIRWGTSGALQMSQLLLARMLAKSAAPEPVVEEEETSFIPPHRPR